MRPTQAGEQAPAPCGLSRCPGSVEWQTMTGDPVEVALLACADLLPRGASVLAACSGGPDSAALTAALAACADALGVRVAVGHVDHALRPESAGDAEQVR